MRNASSRHAFSAAALLLSIVATPAIGAQRTFVASYGDDGNACAINAPCRAFARALTQTNSGGEIIVLDSAGYGVVTIDKSVSIIAPPGVYAYALDTGTVSVVLADNLFSGNNTSVHTQSATVIVDRNTITHNDTALSFTAAGTLQTRGNNTLRGNVDNVSGGALTLFGGM